MITMAMIRPFHQSSKSATPTTGIAPRVAPMLGIRSVMATKKASGAANGMSSSTMGM